jgi:hypothetical protein
MSMAGIAQKATFLAPQITKSQIMDSNLQNSSKVVYRFQNSFPDETGSQKYSRWK